MSMFSKLLFLASGALAGAGLYFFFSGDRDDKDETPPVLAPIPSPQIPLSQETDAPREWFLGFALGKRTAFDPTISQRYELIQDRCVVGFDGKSTIHDFTGSTRKLSGFFEARFAQLEDGVAGMLSIDTASLDSKDPDRDHEMHEKHLHSKRFPSIALAFKSFSKSSWNDGYDRGVGDLLGELEIHGVKRSVTIPVSVVRQGQTLQVQGRVPLKMSDYGITPPSKFAVIRVQDEVNVWFDIQAKLSAVGVEKP